MKVLDLQCAQQHGFEGWFANEDDFRQQLESGLLSCPLCGDTSVQKKLSAPRLNLGHAQAPAQQVDAAERAQAATTVQRQGQVLRALREWMRNTEDVGERFADEARAMHQGVIESRNIRGRATPEQAVALIEDGIDVLPLPVLPALKETLQ